MRKIKSQIFLIVICMMIISCKKEYSTQIQTGTLIGFVTLYDECGDVILNKSGVNVNVMGNSTFKDTTDNYGRFEINNLPSGTYNISYTKQGFSQTKTIGMQFVGGSNPAYISKTLNKPASQTVNLINVFIDNGSPQKWILASVKVTSDCSIGSHENARIFYGLSDTVSSTNYDYSVLFNYYKDSVNEVTENIAYTIVPAYQNYKSGTKVYFVAYGSPAVYSSYINTKTGLAIYSGLNPNPSNIMSHVIP